MADRLVSALGARLRGTPIALGVLAVLGTSLASGFLMDDWFHLDRAGRPLMGGALDFAFDTADAGIRLWVHPAPVTIRYFRPVTSLSFWIDRHVWGLHAWGFHLTNILVHVLAALGVAAIGREIGLPKRFARLAAIAWCVSSASVPAVQWISGRTEILCGAAAFGAAVAFLRWDRTRRASSLSLAIALAALAVGAKETGLAVAPFTACLLVAKRRLQASPSLGPTAPALAMLAAPALIVVTCRLLGPGFPLPEGAYTDPIHGRADALWFALKPAWALIATLLGMPISHLGPLDALRARPLVALVALGAGLTAVGMVMRACGPRVAWPLLAAFVITLAPSLPVLMTTLYFYQPAAALALLLAVAASRVGSFSRWLVYWIVAGAVAHLGIALLGSAASRLQDAQLARIEAMIRRRPVGRLLVVDAPFWMYGVPMAIRVRDRCTAPEVWFVNFTPDLRPGASSALSWPSRLELRVRLARPEGLLRSRVEEFLAFGGSASRHAADSAVAVAAAEPGAHPREVAVRFASEEAFERSLVLRVVHGRAELVERPARWVHGPVPSR